MMSDRTWNMGNCAAQQLKKKTPGDLRGLGVERGRRGGGWPNRIHDVHANYVRERKKNRKLKMCVRKRPSSLGR